MTNNHVKIYLTSLVILTTQNHSAKRRAGHSIRKTKNRLEHNLHLCKFLSPPLTTRKALGVRPETTLTLSKCHATLPLVKFNQEPYKERKSGKYSSQYKQLDNGTIQHNEIYSILTLPAQMKEACWYQTLVKLWHATGTVWECKLIHCWWEYKLVELYWKTGFLFNWRLKIYNLISEKKKTPCIKTLVEALFNNSQNLETATHDQWENE